MLQSLTPEFFDTLIVVIVLLGSAFAVLRLYRDFTRPLPPKEAPQEDRTENHKTED